LSSDGSRVPQGQANGAISTLSSQIADGGLIDVSDLTLADLRDLCDRDDESCLTRALSRLLAASEEDGHHGFQSSI
jgi:hypothetical protein